MLNRLHNNPYYLGSFRLLCLPVGFSDASVFGSVVSNAWDKLRRELHFWQESSATVYYADPVDVDLGITQNGSQLAVPSTIVSTLGAYLDGLVVKSDHTNLTSTGSSAWPKWGIAGPSGCLIAVLVSGSTPGELYQVYGTDDCPWPLVAVVTTGDHWRNVVLRGIAQIFGALGDEYELDGADNDKPAPGNIYPSPSNLIYLTDAQMSDFSSWAATESGPGIDWPDQIFPRPSNWPGFKKTTPRQFRFHTETTANPPRPGPNGGVNFIEGGGGFRHNVLRADFDCLMHRMPNSAQFPIQDDILFAQFARKLWPTWHSARRPSILPIKPGRAWIRNGSSTNCITGRP